MSADVDLAGAAARLGRSYSWMSRSWRTLRHPQTGAAFPLPFVGAAKGQRALWRLAAIEAWKAGAPAAAVAETAGDFAQRAPANDPLPAPVTDRVAALIAAAGG